MTADHVVAATGIASGALFATLGIVLTYQTIPGLIVHTSPVAPVLRHLILSPGIHFRQERDGRIVAGEIFSGNGPNAHRLTEDPRGVADEIMVALRKRLPDIAFAGSRVMLGKRPVPQDGRPILGKVPEWDGLTVAVMHSGVTLAPLVADCLSREILSGASDPLIAPYGLARFGQSGGTADVL
jgi:glycine/D-amino acid oxidase-like deaminating enzyme